MFRTHADTKALFEKYRNISTEDDLRINDNLEMHGAKVLEVIDEVIANIERVDDVLQLLTTTGKMHVRFEGFSPLYFWVSIKYCSYIHPSWTQSRYLQTCHIACGVTSFKIIVKLKSIALKKVKRSLQFSSIKPTHYRVTL